MKNQISSPPLYSIALEIGRRRLASRSHFNLLILRFLLLRWWHRSLTPLAPQVEALVPWVGLPRQEAQALAKSLRLVVLALPQQQVLV